MRKYGMLLLTVVFIFGMVQTGFAADADAKNYIGLGVGQTKLDISSDDAGDPDQLDDSDTGIKLFGGIGINQNFAVEIGYITMGEAVATFNDTPVVGETTKVTAESNSLYVAAMGILPIDKQFEVFGKLGFHYWMSDFTVSGGATGSGDDTGTALMFGIGFAYNMTPSVALRLEYENFTDVGDGVTVTSPTLGSITMDGDDVSFMGLGVAFKF